MENVGNLLFHTLQCGRRMAKKYQLGAIWIEGEQVECIQWQNESKTKSVTSEIVSIV